MPLYFIFYYNILNNIFMYQILTYFLYYIFLKIYIFNDIYKYIGGLTMNKKNFYRIIMLVYIIVFSINIVNAATLSAKTSISKNETITVTLDFGQYVAAYDSLEVTFNDNIMEYVSGSPLKEGLWWDPNNASLGIKTKTYTFKGTKDGISTIRVKVKGAVSANQTMEALGDIEVYKKITIGKGYTKGDLSGDGLVDSADAAMILNTYKYGK